MRRPAGAACRQAVERSPCHTTLLCRSSQTHERGPAGRGVVSSPATPGAPTPCTPSSCGGGSPGASPTGWTRWSGSNAPTSSSTSASLGESRPDGLLGQHDDARGPRVLPVRPHRRPDPRRPRRLRPAAEGPPRRVPHPGPGPARADPVPPGRPDHHRPPRRPGLPARHQRAARLRGRSGPDRGLRRDPARPPGPAPGRQGQQARHHADHRPGAAGPGGLPRRAHRRAR